jgi:hypothetical protein
MDTNPMRRKALEETGIKEGNPFLNIVVDQ